MCDPEPMTPGTANTRWMYLKARLRIGDPPPLVRRSLGGLPWVWGACWVLWAVFRKRVAPFTEMTFAITLLYLFYFWDRVGVGPRREPATAYHPLHPVFRAAGIIAGFALLYQGWQALGE